MPSEKEIFAVIKKLLLEFICDEPRDVEKLQPSDRIKSVVVHSLDRLDLVDGLEAEFDLPTTDSFDLGHYETFQDLIDMVRERLADFGKKN